MDHLPPATSVRTLREPAPPVSDSVAEQLFCLAHPRAAAGSVLGIDPAQGEGGVLPFSERKVGNHTIALTCQWHRGSQPEAQPRPLEARAMHIEVGLVSGAGVVEGRMALEPK